MAMLVPLNLFIRYNRYGNEIKEIKNVNYASVIMYHRFGDSKYPSTNIKKEQFLEHVNELLKPKYNVIKIEQALNAINNKIKPIAMACKMIRHLINLLAYLRLKLPPVVKPPSPIISTMSTANIAITTII